MPTTSPSQSHRLHNDDNRHDNTMIADSITSNESTVSRLLGVFTMERISRNIGNAFRVILQNFYKWRLRLAARLFLVQHRLITLYYQHQSSISFRGRPDGAQHNPNGPQSDLNGNPGSLLKLQTNERSRRMRFHGSHLLPDTTLNQFYSSCVGIPTLPISPQNQSSLLSPKSPLTPSILPCIISDSLSESNAASSITNAYEMMIIAANYRLERAQMNATQ